MKIEFNLRKVEITRIKDILLLPVNDNIGFNARSPSCL